jgi:hypothetical protein
MGLGCDKVYCVRTIDHPVTADNHSCQTTVMVSFLVVDFLSEYNAIINCVTLNRMRVVTSTYHIKMKFLTEYGVGEVKGGLGLGT